LLAGQEHGRTIALGDLRGIEKAGRDGAVASPPFPIQDSSMMVPLAKADCLVIREPHAPRANAGSRCMIIQVQPLNAPLVFGVLSERNKEAWDFRPRLIS